MTLSGVAAAVGDGSQLAVELVDEALDAADDAQNLNALAELHAEAARHLAVRRDDEATAGRIRGPLHGVPVTVKDLFVVDGFRLCAGTRAPIPPLGRREATAVRRLRDAGAIVLATTNLVEIALGIHGENPWTGDVRNPHDRRRQAGGSSSGSAVAVASGIGLASLGTDTGGSLRIPASLCGVTTIKPSYGTVPADGVLPLSQTCDHVGPLASSVADVAYLLDVLTGSSPHAVERARPRRIGIPSRFLSGRLGTAVREAFEALLAEVAATSGVTIVDVAPAHLELADRAYVQVVRPEAAHVHRAALEMSPELFSPAVREALLLGRSLSDGDYRQGRRLADLVRRGIEATFEDIDVLLLPATPLPAPLLGSSEVVIESGRVAHRDAFLPMTLPFNLAGVPAVCLPFASVEELPVGVQLVTARGRDRQALAYAQWLETFLGHGRSPTVA